jgi:signal-transduction protein with cAMP-binding, CBS, and nucleotidyltransferase domain
MGVTLIGLEVPQFMRTSEVKAVMTRGPALLEVDPGCSCRVAEEICRHANVRHLLVTDEGRFAGVVCLCDLVTAERGQAIEQVMARDVYAISPGAMLAEAAAAMSSLGVGCLPVIDGDSVVGVITRGDLRRGGVPETLLGARYCTACCSAHGVRQDPRSGLDYCLDCFDQLSPLSDEELGTGD